MFDGLKCPSKGPSCSPCVEQEPTFRDESPFVPLPSHGDNSSLSTLFPGNDLDDVSDVSETFPILSSPPASPTARKSLEFISDTPNEHTNLRRSPRKHKSSSTDYPSTSPKRLKCEMKVSLNSTMMEVLYW